MVININHFPVSILVPEALFLSTALPQCKVEPSRLQIDKGTSFRINITVRGSPRPHLSLHNPFGASWHLVDQENGLYTMRRQLEVAGVKLLKKGDYTVGRASQTMKQTTNSYDCLVDLIVNSQSDASGFFEILCNIEF